MGRLWRADRRGHCGLCAAAPGAAAAEHGRDLSVCLAHQPADVPDAQQDAADRGLLGRLPRRILRGLLPYQQLHHGAGRERHADRGQAHRRRAARSPESRPLCRWRCWSVCCRLRSPAGCSRGASSASSRKSAARRRSATTAGRCRSARTTARCSGGSCAI